jgi:uncharacterized membrane protein YoaK (UPF0700 family)
MRRAAVALALTTIGGFVDAFGFLALSNVYTANMSGNTVQLAVHAGSGGWGTAGLHAYTVAMFLAGLIVSGIVIELGIRWHVRRLLAAAMAIEGALLVAFALLGSDLLRGGAAASGPEGWPLYLLIAVAAVAMGIQNTTLRMAGILRVYTTHVTGTITQFSEAMVDWLFARGRRERQSDPGEGRQPPGRRALLMAGLWLGFLAGAVLAAVLRPLWGMAALGLPIAGVATVGLADLLHPLEREDGNPPP